MPVTWFLSVLVSLGVDLAHAQWHYEGPGYTDLSRLHRVQGVRQEMSGGAGDGLWTDSRGLSGGYPGTLTYIQWTN